MDISLTQSLLITDCNVENVFSVKLLRKDMYC